MAEARSEATVERMTLWQRIEHLVLMVSISLLVLSGLALAYHATALGRLLIRCMGGLEGRYLIHRGAAILLLALGVAHVFALAVSSRRRTDFRDALPTGRDFREAWARLRFRLTGRGQMPKYGRYTPMQKFQYLGIFMGCVLMALSGLVLWFKAEALNAFPKAFFDLVLLVHSEQAQLIFILFILWHVYDVHVAEGNFPMNPSWITGKMREDVFKRQHGATWEAMQEGRKP